MDNLGYEHDTSDSDTDSGQDIPDIDRLCLNPYR